MGDGGLQTALSYNIGLGHVARFSIASWHRINIPGGSIDCKRGQREYEERTANLARYRVVCGV